MSQSTPNISYFPLPEEVLEGQAQVQVRLAILRQRIQVHLHLHQVVV